MKREEWIENTIRAFDGIKRAVPSSELKERLYRIPDLISNSKNSVPQSWYWMAAASFAILFWANIFSATSYKKTANNESVQTEQFADSYFSHLKQISL